MDKKDITNSWVPITDLISLSMNNNNGLLYDIRVMKYTDNTKKSIRCSPIGYIDGSGFHTNENDKDRIYLMEFTINGKVMFFEKNKHIQQLEDSIIKKS